jgi:HTH-type transcriptional regulator/antitoxin HigA
MPIKPIRDDAGHAAAIAGIEALWGAETGTPDGDELDVLATLVDAYERGRWPDRDADPIDCLNEVMRERGLNQSDLAALIGSRSRASEVLRRRRVLSVGMIHTISRAWDIPADLLVRPTRIEPAA